MSDDGAAPVRSPEGIASPAMAGSAPATEIVEGRYLIRFARSPQEIEAALELRYRVFNLELGEGLEESHVTGRDEDRFDACCHHLVVIDARANAIVGTYRMQTRAMTGGRSFYSDDEFVLSDLTDAVLDDAVEVGRACVAREHRKQKVLFGLWRGLAEYMTHQRKRYLFGCCSLTSQDAREAAAVSAYLERHGLVHPRHAVRARPAHACEDVHVENAEVDAVRLPTLFGTYLRFGALACSAPAIDRAFRTIDFLVLMDTATLAPRIRQTFFRS